jgi:hypothetical protein
MGLRLHRGGSWFARGWRDDGWLRFPFWRFRERDATQARSVATDPVTAHSIGTHISWLTRVHSIVNMIAVSGIAMEDDRKAAAPVTAKAAA